LGQETSNAAYARRELPVRQRYGIVADTPAGGRTSSALLGEFSQMH
jgi:hypothetical protein